MPAPGVISPGDPEGGPADAEYLCPPVDGEDLDIPVSVAVAIVVRCSVVIVVSVALVVLNVEAVVLVVS